MSLIEDQPRWAWGGDLKRARERLFPGEEWRGNTFIDLNARHPVVVAFGKYILERFETREDAHLPSPMRQRREIARGHDWGQTMGLALDNLREGLTEWRSCPHPPPRVSEREQLGFCRACASWRGSSGAWLPPLGVEE
ncbi:MAG TPA: hypothetical protein VJV75_03820 [Candidatus Polarisedimenticolia bacterium]|nr:hypothetical protein [Candidatus Polarisedimenticolia bacterium]